MTTLADLYAAVDEETMRYEAGAISAEQAMSNIKSIVKDYENGEDEAEAVRLALGGL